MKSVLVFQHVPHETLGALEACFHQVRLTSEYIELFRETPRRLDLSQAAGLVVLGGPMNVDEVEQYPFLGPEMVYPGSRAGRASLSGDLLGVAIAGQSDGAARVYPNRVKEIGWYRSSRPAATIRCLAVASDGKRCSNGMAIRLICQAARSISLPASCAGSRPFALGRRHGVFSSTSR